jgi:2'-5' RNA ligase
VSSFLCLLPTGEALIALRALQRPEVQGLRWEPERRWHLTLRYTPYADEATCSTLTEVADEVVAELAPPRVRLGPKLERLGRDGTAVVPAVGLEAAAAGVDEHLDGVLGERDEPFFGHLTVARLRRPLALPEEVLGLELSCSFEAAAIYLIESNPGPQGSVYEVLHVARFAGAPS